MGNRNMAKKDQDFRRKIMPYVLLAFGLIGALLILLDIYMNLQGTLVGI